jgi:L,D-peptidoglycan transpeptidase YkuD (ErfK/YbiS/YcfS/YnhG family)
MIAGLGSTTAEARAVAPVPPLAATGAAASTDGVHCPDNLAERLSSTGAARQLLTVEAAQSSSVIATVEIWQREAGCWQPAGGPWTAFIGRNGFSDHHREGDGTTPTGIYGIGPEMYGNALNPGTAYPYHRLVCGDWWDEDPTSPQYNTFQHVPCGQAPPFGGSSEALWTETSVYPSFAVIEYNAHPVIAYAGSAIFLHADIGAPTSGCVALPRAQLDRVLRWLAPGRRPAVVMGPAAEITRL